MEAFSNCSDARNAAQGKMSNPSPWLKHSIVAAIGADPEPVVSEVRVAISAGFVVLEGYVVEPEHIDRVIEIVHGFASEEVVKNFLFCRRG